MPLMKTLCLLICALPISVCWAQDQAAGRKIVVACVGDSITEMKGRVKGKSYPQYLQDLLGERYEVQNFGKSGSCVIKDSDIPYWTQEAYRNFLTATPDLVIIALGTNDSRPNNWKKQAEFARDYKELIARARGLATKPVVLVSLPIPMITHPGAWQYMLNGDTIAKEIVPALARIAEEEKCPVVDFFHQYTSTEEAYIDGVHPSDAGLAEMAAIASKAVLALPAAGTATK